MINDKLFLGKPIIHIVSDKHPNNGFVPVKASLEDVYFSQITNN